MGKGASQACSHLNASQKDVGAELGCHVCRGPYGGQDPNLLGNPLLTGNLANSLADSLGLTQGLAAVPPSQSLPTGLPNGLPGNGALGFNMGLPNGGGRHHIDSLSAVCLRPLSRPLTLSWMGFRELK